MSSIALLLQDPVEAADRALNKFENVLDRQPERQREANGFPTREEVRAHAFRHWGYEVSDPWEEAFERVLGAPVQDGFDAVWSDLEDDLRDTGAGLDADVRLATAVWSVVRSVKPGSMIETGVSRGILTRVILEAMSANGHGHLYSIDLPPQHVRWRDQTRAAVPALLHGRWTFLRGSSRRHLPRLLRRLGSIDVFLHDSQHTRRNMAFEMNRALPRLRPGGVLICDDAHENGAWADVSRGHRSMLVQERRKAGMFGVLVKSGA